MNNVGFIRKIKAIIEEREAEFVLLLCHQNADPDAVCSSYALSKLMNHLKSGIDVEVASPESVSKISKILLEHFSMRVVNDEPSFDKTDIIFMVDTNTIGQLGEWGEHLKEACLPLIVIDHHAPHPETGKIASLCIYDENASSTCEIIYSLFKEANIKPSRDVAEALLLGAAFDTKHFALANASTFKMIAELIDLGVNVREIMGLLTAPMDVSERIARLKACKRMKLMKMGGWIIVLSHVSSFQASAARVLIDVGADLAIVGSQRKNELSISMRSSQDFYGKTGIHLGRDIANPLGKYLNGMGGGHSTSAGVNGTGDLKSAFKHVTRILKERIRQSQNQ
ncbi:DHH family phosphoesterase [Candidatus Bathyarchaeota archaeon]|nr:DHH family phosphoesterase [Candidatus Bathyarchaeota archaeon]